MIKSLRQWVAKITLRNGRNTEYTNVDYDKVLSVFIDNHLNGNKVKLVTI